MDAAVKEQAKDLYVLHGFSMQTITDMLKGRVTRKTLYNWKDKHGWDALRKNEVTKKDSIREDLLDLLESAIATAKEFPSASNIFAVAKMAGVIKTMQSVKLDDEDEEETDDKPKKLPDDLFDQIDKELMGK